MKDTTQKIAAEAAEAAKQIRGKIVDLTSVSLDYRDQWMEKIIQSAIDQVRTETLAECRAATEQQICDLQDRAHASEGGEEPLNIVIHVLREVVKRCGGNSHLGSLAKNALAELEQSPPPTVKQWREAHAREP